MKVIKENGSYVLKHEPEYDAEMPHMIEDLICSIMNSIDADFESVSEPQSAGNFGTFYALKDCSQKEYVLMDKDATDFFKGKSVSLLSPETAGKTAKGEKSTGG